MSEAVPFNPAWTGLRIRSTVVPTAPTPRVKSQGTQAVDTSSTGKPTPPPALVNSGMGNYHEALRNSTDRTAIPQAMLHMRPNARQFNALHRKMIAAVSRYLVDNGGVASYVVGQIADYSVPVTPRSQCDDPELRKVYNEYFCNWQKRCDYTRRFTFKQIQRLACIAMDVEGDQGASFTEEKGFPQLRIWDTFRIGGYSILDTRDGVVMDEKSGVVNGYDVVEGLSEFSSSSVKTTFIPFDQFFLLYDPDRYANYRGWSPLRRGSNDLRDKNDLKAFLKLKEKIGAALAAVIQQDGPLEEDVWGNDTGTDGNEPAGDGEKPPTQSEKKLSLAELLGGDIPVIQGDLKQFVAQAIQTTSIDFMDKLDAQFCLGLGIPPAFFLDEKLTGPNVRSVLGKVQKKFNNRKELMANFVEWCWLRVIAWGISNDGLPAGKNWQKISNQFTPVSTIDLGDTMANERADVLVGQMSETMRYANRGQDFEHEHETIKSEISLKIKDAIAVAEKASNGDEQIFEMLLPVVFARFGLVGVPTTALAVQEANDEQASNDKGKNDKKEPAKKE